MDTVKLSAPRVFGPGAKLLWEKAATVGAPANGYRESFVIPEPPGGGPLYFVKLELHDSQGRLVSDNFYWLRAKGTEDYRSLQSLPMTKLKATCSVETHGAEKLARIRIANPTDRMAFFVQLALTDGRGGAEILPILWDDNYFSLLPGESREITARFAAKDVGSHDPALEVGGWNVETEYQCTSLAIAPREIKAGQPSIVTARIAHTFLDGSCVTLLVDGQPAGRKWAWARGEKGDELAFAVSFPKPGEHTLAVGSRSTQMKVNP